MTPAQIKTQVSRGHTNDSADLALFRVFCGRKRVANAMTFSIKTVCRSGEEQDTTTRVFAQALE